jgi:hypothetical protein
MTIAPVKKKTTQATPVEFGVSSIYESFGKNDSHNSFASAVYMARSIFKHIEEEEGKQRELRAYTSRGYSSDNKPLTDEAFKEKKRQLNREAANWLLKAYLRNIQSDNPQLDIDFLSMSSREKTLLRSILSTLCKARVEEDNSITLPEGVQLWAIQP